jgi:hypothetical protein
LAAAFARDASLAIKDGLFGLEQREYSDMKLSSTRGRSGATVLIKLRMD